MATDLANSVRSAAETVAQYIAGAAELTVETKYVEVGPGGAVNIEQARPAARTVIKLDGDSETVVPMRQGQNGAFELDTALFNLHERNVAAAVEYRSKILSSVLGLLMPAGGIRG